MNILNKLKELNFPLGEYVVIGSGVLAALELREANDVDIAVSQKLLKQLQESGKFERVVKKEVEYLVAPDVEILTKLNWEAYPTTAEEAIAAAMIIEGFPFLNIQETIKFKTALGRDKDFRDIKLLEEYLAR